MRTWPAVAQRRGRSVRPRASPPTSGLAGADHARGSRRRIALIEARSVGRRLDLTALGLGAIIGTGIFVILGEAIGQAGPAIVVSFVLAGLTCAFSALSYAELASTIPVSGSAYTYAYATMGELVAWIIGWDLILEYGVSVAAVAVGWGGYLNDAARLVFGITLPDAIARRPARAASSTSRPSFLVLAVAALLIVGVRESARTNTVMVIMKLAVLILFIVLGLHRVPRRTTSPLQPHGLNGILDAARADLLRLHRLRRDLDVGRGDRRPQRATCRSRSSARCASRRCSTSSWRSSRPARCRTTSSTARGPAGRRAQHGAAPWART